MNTPNNDAPALPLEQQFKDAFRATGYVTNGQAWELADAAMIVHRNALAASPTPVAADRASVADRGVQAVPGEPVARDWELPCDDCAGTGKVDISEALHVDGRYMGDQLLRETCNTCTSYGFTVCVADIPKEILQ